MQFVTLLLHLVPGWTIAVTIPSIMAADILKTKFSTNSAGLTEKDRELLDNLRATISQLSLSHLVRR
jgi:hypothetical protein